MNIGADATLVSSAGSLARSMGPADMTKSMDGILEARGDMLDNMEKNFKKATELIDGANAFGSDSIKWRYNRRNFY